MDSILSKESHLNIRGFGDQIEAAQWATSRTQRHHQQRWDETQLAAFAVRIILGRRFAVWREAITVGSGARGVL